MRLGEITLTFALASCLATSSLGAQPSATNTESASVDADSLIVDHKSKSARFEGNVKARYRNLELHCQNLEVRYDDGGALIALKATGSVVVKKDGTRASARSARLDARQQLLVLEGNPTLTNGPHTLTGARIQVDLRTGTLDVIQARGRFILKDGSQ